jgi:protein involved in polysaccharide export with SLBB domain
MLLRATALALATAGAVGMVFADTPPAGAGPMKECSAHYQAAGKASPSTHGKANVANVRRPPSEIRLGMGDVVSITIFEAAAGGLFIPSDAGARPGNFVTLPNQIVDSKGNVTVPYAGTIRAAGRTPSELQQAIIDALRDSPR